MALKMSRDESEHHPQKKAVPVDTETMTLEDINAIFSPSDDLIFKLPSFCTEETPHHAILHVEPPLLPPRAKTLSGVPVEPSHAHELPPLYWDYKQHGQLPAGVAATTAEDAAEWSVLPSTPLSCLAYAHGLGRVDDHQEGWVSLADAGCNGSSKDTSRSDRAAVEVRKAGLIKCPYGNCKKTFTRSSNLSVHERQVHLKLMPYYCFACQRGFQRKTDLHRHEIAVHNKESPWYCDKCNKYFARESVHKNHPKKCKKTAGGGAVADDDGDEPTAVAVVAAVAGSMSPPNNIQKLPVK